MADFALGSIGLAAQLFVTAVHTYQFISTAQSLTKESPTIYWRLRIEQIRFEAWGRFWGIESGSLDTALDNAGIYDSVCGILREMQQLLLDTEKLSTKYGLTTANFEDEGNSDAERSEKGVSKANKQSVAAKFKYAFKDKAKFDSLINDLKAFNDGLYSLLRLNEYRAVNLVGQSEALRTTGQVHSVRDLQIVTLELDKAAESNSRNKDFYQELYRGATSKLLLEQENEKITDATFPVGISTAPHPDLESCRKDLNSLSEYLKDTPSSEHIVAKFTPPDSSVGVKILIEWKPMGPNHPRLRLINARVNSLAKLLAAESVKPDFRVLDCLGFVKDSTEEHPRFGYLFRLPDGAVAKPPASLYDILSRGSDGLLPDLGDRFELAKVLAASVLRLHDCCWVHGGLDSANVAFFWYKEMTPDQASSPTTKEPGSPFAQVPAYVPVPASKAPSIRITRPYLLGFTYSRPTDPAETTLEWTANPVPTAANPRSLYRHPFLQLQSPAHPAFVPGSGSTSMARRQRLDLYSLGLILLEIGLWERLDAMWKPKYATNTVVFVQKLLRVYIPRLSHRTGATYCDVVRALLGDGEWEDDSWQKGDMQEKDWAEIISRLAICRA